MGLITPVKDETTSNISVLRLPDININSLF